MTFDFFVESVFVEKSQVLLKVKFVIVIRVRAKKCLIAIVAPISMIIVIIVRKVIGVVVRMTIVIMVSIGEIFAASFNWFVVIITNRLLMPNKQ